MIWALNNPFAKADSKAASPQSPGPAKPENTVNDDPNKKINDPNVKSKGTGGDDPLADLASLWQPNVDKDGKAIPDESDDTSAYMPSLDPKKLTDMVGKMNFTDGITKEELDALKAGGEDSVAAVMNLVNRAGRKSFMTAFQASGKLAEQGFTKAQDRFMKSVPSRIREMMVENGLSDAIHITNNPAFKPLVDSVKNQFLKKHPKANPQQINQGVKQYFDALETEMSAGRNKAQDTDAADPKKKLAHGAPDADFEAWLGDEIKGLGGSAFNDDEVKE